MIGTEYKPYVIDIGYLFPPSLADFLGGEDEVHVFREVTEHLDVSHLDSDFNGMGQHPYHPLMLLRLLMWGMVNRVVSTRKIEVLARRDVSSDKQTVIRVQPRKSSPNSVAAKIKSFWLGSYCEILVIP